MPNPYIELTWIHSCWTICELRVESISWEQQHADLHPQSQAVIAGPHIFVSGQIPADASGKLVEGSIADKTTACCEAVKNILKETGSDISRVVKV